MKLSLQRCFFHHRGYQLRALCGTAKSAGPGYLRTYPLGFMLFFDWPFALNWRLVEGRRLWWCFEIRPWISLNVCWQHAWRPVLRSEGYRFQDHHLDLRLRKA